MAKQTIEISGQRLVVEEFSDYYLSFIQALFDSEGQLIMDLRRHSAVIEMTVEIIVPKLPKRFWRKSGDSYYWLGTSLEFGELINGMYLSYFKYELEKATEAGDTERIERAKVQIDFVEGYGKDANADIEALKAELEKLKAQSAQT